MGKTFLIDRLITHRFRPSSLNIHLKYMASSDMFLIDNVHKFYWNNQKQMWEITDFPNIAPPFRTFFMACENPIYDEVYRPDVTGFKYGVLFSTYNLSDKFLWPDSVIDYLAEYGKTKESILQDGARWMYNMVPFFETSQLGLVEPICSFKMFVREDGQAMNNGILLQTLDTDRLSRHAKRLRLDVDEVEKDINQTYLGFLYVSFLSLSFTHCRNVTVKTEDESRRSRKQRERKTNNQAVRFKTLHIEPMTRILREQGEQETVGLPQALHKCRGHFKDYRDGSGLFGKHKDIYWWDEQERGDSSFGTIVKDYDVAIKAEEK